MRILHGFLFIIIIYCCALDAQNNNYTTSSGSLNLLDEKPIPVTIPATTQSTSLTLLQPVHQISAGGQSGAQSGYSLPSFGQFGAVNGGV